MHRTIGVVALLAIAACSSGEDPAPSVAPPPPPTPATPPPPPPPPTRAGPLCTYHGVCWASPFPQGNALHAVRALAADRVVAVGDRGTVLTFDGTSWALEDVPTRERLLDLASAPTGELFAVGEHGTVLRRDAAGTWTALTSGTEARLHGVVALGASDVVAVGDGGLALHFDGSAWTRETLPADLPEGTDLIALAHGGDATYALGARGTDAAPERLVLARDAAGWRALSTVTGDDAGSIVVLADGTLVLSGSGAHHGDGSTWRERSFGSDRPLDALFVAGPDDVWAAGYEGRIAHWNGHAWTRAELPTVLDADDVDGTGPSDVWVVGEHGLVAHFDGLGWSVVSQGTANRLEGVGGLAPNDVWVVGDHASLHFDGQTWSPGGLDGLAELELEALGTSVGALFAVGADGAIRRYTSAGWAEEASGTTTKLEGVWASGADHAIAVGGSEWTERAGGTWTAIVDRPAATGVWGSAPTDVWAVGGGGIEHFDGTAWTPVAGTESTPLVAVWGSGPRDVWAVGADGHVLHFDGTGWAASEGVTTQDLVGVWGRAPDDVWAVGEHGTLLHWDGTRWRWRDSGTDELLHAVWGGPDGPAWIVGHGGVVLRLDAP